MQRKRLITTPYNKATQQIWVSFGSDHLDKFGNSLMKKYMIVTGVNYAACRAQTEAIRGGLWCTDYSMEDLQSRIDAYGLTEVSQFDALVNQN